jgi:HAE1 family hydrophobic/amphiphilic exporter-1
MSYQEKVVGGQIYWAFGLCPACWCISCWPDNMRAGSAGLGHSCGAVVAARPDGGADGLRIENNLYTQIGIILLIALSAKNAILIVEVALELHVRDRKPLTGIRGRGGAAPASGRS